jgi:hypothetical protein
MRWPIRLGAAVVKQNPVAARRQMAKRVRDLSDAIRGMAAVAVPKQTDIHMCWAVVVGVATSAPNTVDLAPGGISGGAGWFAVSYEGWYSPTVGDNVLVIIDGSDRIVVGTMAPNGGSGGGEDDKTWAIMGVDVNRYPGWTAAVPSGVTASIDELWCVTSSGTATFSLYQNGTAVVGPATANSTHTSDTFAAITVSDGDYFELDVTAISGAPDLSVSVILTKSA